MIAKSFQAIRMRWSRRSGSPVTRLSRCGGPNAVSWCVGTAVVQAFYRMMPRGPVAHVTEKCGKGLSPSITNVYSASTISMIVARLGSITAPLHIVPDVIFGRPATTKKAMRNARLTTFAPFIKQATAGLCVPTRSGDRSFAAFTTGQPKVGTIWPPMRECDKRQASLTYASPIFGFGSSHGATQFTTFVRDEFA